MRLAAIFLSPPLYLLFLLLLPLPFVHHLTTDSIKTLRTPFSPQYYKVKNKKAQLNKSGTGTEEVGVLLQKRPTFVFII